MNFLRPKKEKPVEKLNENLGVNGNTSEFNIISGYGSLVKYMKSPDSIGFERCDYNSLTYKVCTITFSHCKFNFKVYLNKLVEIIEEMQNLKGKSYNLIFNTCIFNDGVFSRKGTFNCSIDFVTVTFSQELSFIDSIFKEDVLFSLSRLEITLYCKSLTFTKSFIIESCGFYNHLYFFNCQLLENFIGRNLQVNKEFQFQTITCKSVEILNSNFEKCIFGTSKISHFFRLYKTKFKHLEIFDLCLEQMPLFEHEIKTGSMTRETARFLKHEALKADNSILALDYHVKEMDIYRKETFRKGKPGTWLLLLLNKISNNYGSCWELGVVFTVFFWFIFYSLFVILRDGWGNHFIWADPVYIKQSISYFWLFDGMDELTKRDTVNWRMTIVFVLGKIFIAYGIYQTVSAFRKYGK